MRKGNEKMLKRLTNPNKKYGCRLPDCEVDEWMYDIYDEYPSIIHQNPCKGCPFIKIVNKLAEYEDREFDYEDDLK